MAAWQKFTDDAAHNCARRGLTVQQTADELGVHAGTISRWKERHPRAVFRDGRGTHMIDEISPAQAEANMLLRQAQRATSPWILPPRLEAVQRCFALVGIDPGAENAIGQMMERTVWDERQIHNRVSQARELLRLE